MTIDNILEIEKDVISELKEVSKRLAERYQNNNNIKIEVNYSQANDSVKVNITCYDI